MYSDNNHPPKIIKSRFNRDFINNFYVLELVIVEDLNQLMHFFQVEYSFVF